MKISKLKYSVEVHKHLLCVLSCTSDLLMRILGWLLVNVLHSSLVTTIPSIVNGDIQQLENL